MAWEGRQYLLSLPFRSEVLHHIGELELSSRERNICPLAHFRILHEELMLRDTRGEKHYFDVVIQELPQGKPLTEAVHEYRATDLRTVVERMKHRLDTIGFRHNNLRPANIHICESGVARPLRYWYAEWKEYGDNDIASALELIERHYNPDTEPLKTPLLTHDAEVQSSNELPPSGIRITRRGSRYGFTDEDGRVLVPAIYAKVSPFCEGRAVVVRNNKMGAIDDQGRKVVPVIYKSLEFDVATGYFFATNDSYRYLINYAGKIIRRLPVDASREALTEYL